MARSACSAAMITRSCAGVRELLETEPYVSMVGETGTAASALARNPAVRPGVAVLNVRLPGGNGVTVCRDIRSTIAQMACATLTTFGNDEAWLCHSL